jgi:1,4-dihydroxy-2-naphthoyl-CoA synthase
VNYETTNDLHLEKTATQKDSDRTSDTPFTVEELTRALTAAKFEEKE